MYVVTYDKRKLVIDMDDQIVIEDAEQDSDELVSIFDNELVARIRDI